MIRVDFNASAAVRVLDNLAQKQAPFAMAKALTMTARDVQTDLRADLGQSFTVRSGWLSKGIVFKGARKSDLQAEVGSRDGFMALQAHGGDKRARPGKLQGVPIEARPTPQTMTPRSKWPGRILKSKAGEAAIIETGRGGGKAVGVFKRIGKGKAARLVLFYALVKKVRVAPRWDFDGQVRQSVGKHWRGNARKALVEAIATAKAGAKV